MSRVKKEEVFVILIHFPKSGCKKLSALTEYELKVTKDFWIEPAVLLIYYFINRYP
jgi:hypothetical protein